ncbi:MAG: hypothetical protein IH956_09585 [Chloroflexi bacterium]|nr:hypothetical protein [Chloroflexota bacterium]
MVIPTPTSQFGGIGSGIETHIRADVLRDLVDAYFDALNSYDLNAALSILEEGYKTDATSAIQQQIDELEAAGAQLKWTEDQAPGLTGPTSMVMFVSVEGPSGTNRWQIQFTELGRNSGNWVISGVKTE